MAWYERENITRSDEDEHDARQEGAPQAPASSELRPAGSHLAAARTSIKSSHHEGTVLTNLAMQPSETTNRLGREPCPFGWRVASALLDCVAWLSVAGAVHVIAMTTTHHQLNNLLTLALAWCLLLVEALTGFTPGKLTLGLRVQAADGERVSLPSRALARLLVGWLAPAALFRRDRRAPHDRMAGSTVVALPRARRGLRLAAGVSLGAYGILLATAWWLHFVAAGVNRDQSALEVAVEHVELPARPPGETAVVWSGDASYELPWEMGGLKLERLRHLSYGQASIDDDEPRIVVQRVRRPIESWREKWWLTRLVSPPSPLDLTRTLIRDSLGTGELVSPRAVVRQALASSKRRDLVAGEGHVKWLRVMPWNGGLALWTHRELLEKTPTGDRRLVIRDELRFADESRSEGLLVHWRDPELWDPRLPQVLLATLSFVPPSAERARDAWRSAEEDDIVIHGWSAWYIEGATAEGAWRLREILERSGTDGERRAFARVVAELAAERPELEEVEAGVESWKSLVVAPADTWRSDEDQARRVALLLRAIEKRTPDDLTAHFLDTAQGHVEVRAGDLLRETRVKSIDFERTLVTLAVPASASTSAHSSVKISDGAFPADALDLPDSRECPERFLGAMGREALFQWRDGSGIPSIRRLAVGASPCGGWRIAEIGSVRLDPEPGADEAMAPPEETAHRVVLESPRSDRRIALVALEP